MTTIATLQRLTAPKLADMLLKANPSSADSSPIAIVDVRDDDYIGGHIRTSMHFPLRSIDATMPTLLRKLADKETVVFHCAFSQQRGPGAALRYLREREAMPQKKTGEEEGVNEAKGEKKEQKVYVLDRGFVGWQEEYGSDERLTEGYRKDLWKDGYWG
ncbi:Rhodanese-like domain-containing protein [Pseudomassariella vexata]|uniref:Rhodanese-like domain-containing protein n=1 Tax=Pseudomassariella vexata TaxID=1141098 RepID=A0A1Y2DFZ4_9PEZI|nr:Rhodanese-like domain-containing protein [Pseudomassariella vexata]ORY58202.1 Rhodanese-like domain-containing protein [Pseudomassariella vexata]